MEGNAPTCGRLGSAVLVVLLAACGEPGLIMGDGVAPAAPGRRPDAADKGPGTDAAPESVRLS